jgi:hypothetical protein
MARSPLPAAILVDSSRFLEARDAVVAAAPSADPLLVLPFFLADADDPGLAAVTAVPGVIGVVPGDHLTLSMLQGLDRVAALCLGLVSDWEVGGVELGQEYPTIVGQPKGEVARSAACAALNLSLTPPNDAFAPTLPTDVVNHATHSLAELTVPVVAAGNHHQRGAPFETMSPWAEPDWVLAVGATTDEAGTIEWPHSARGSAKQPAVGPDVLTWGQDALARDWFGTSFAAARTSAMVAICRAWLFELAANLDRLAGRPFGVPQVGIAFVDRELKTMQPAALDLAALPVIKSTPGAIDGPHDKLAAALAGWEAVGASRRLLLKAAAATTPTTSVPLSAPSLTPERLKQFLDALSLDRLLEIVAPTAERTAPASSTPVFPVGTADELWTLMTNSQPRWGWDIDTQTPLLRPVHPLP